MNDSIQQFRDLYQSMTPAARVTAALLLGVIVVSFGYLFQHHSTGADEYLFNGEMLQPREADAIEAALAKAKVDGIERKGNRFLVPSDKKLECMASIADAGVLPANFDTLMDDALEVSPFMPHKLQLQKLKSARERQLSMIVRNMDGIADAKVMYDIRESQGFSKEKSSATVSVRPAGGETLDGRRQKLIRAAVAGAIAGLSPVDVTILDQSSGSEFAGGAGVSAEDFDDRYYRTRSKYEYLMQTRIEDLLRGIPGIRVQVNAELDKTLTLEERTLSSQGEAVALHERIQKEEISNQRIEGGQQPGITAQGPGRAAPDEETAKIVSKTETQDSDTSSFVPTSEKVLSESGLTPTNVQASISVPMDYLDRVWRQKNPDAAPEDQPPADLLTKIEEDTARKIKTSVSKLLPKRVAQENYSDVEVTFLPSLTPDPIEAPSMATEGLFWASSHLNTLLTACFALVGLVMLRSMVKSIPKSEPPVTIAAADIALEENAVAEAAEPKETAEERRPKLKLKKGSNLRDDLTEIVKEDPDAAAAILRTWIANAG
ncbi:hypothetical protein [Adhaeretor mobilis]|uniref:Flagellar M-ring protein n=1 Tax=Adhaeretor mobilis TaxID=1930276 RepID=A0A517MYY3_9BACT|nr:hypothetical protein [Adhaeretor mobilis]QDT00054.1 Flagellar M-ring protein [Adhaeretor mobilis]